MNIINASRREFLKGTAVATGGLVVGMSLDPIAKLNPFTPAQAAEGVPTPGQGFNPNLFVTIGKDGTVTIISHRVEMGQGVRTSVPMILADELEADWGRVKIAQATGDKKFGNQYTDGSRSIRHNYQRMREFGATARTMLEKAASIQWKVPEGECKAQNHKVVHVPSGKSADYGELVETAMTLPVPDAKSVKLKDPKDFRYIGTPLTSVDFPDMTRGKAIYGIDVRVDGMKYASVEHCPVTYGKVKSFDASEAMKVPGVEKVIELAQTQPPIAFNTLGGIAVIGSNTWAVFEGRKKLKIDWDLGDNVVYNSEQFRKDMEATSRQDGKVVRSEGDIKKGMEGAAKVVEAQFYVPHFAHATMEPPAAVASVKGDKCEIWTSCQDPQAARATVAAAIGFKEDQVTSYTPLLGGAFGRKSKPDFGAEAALISKAIGAPVKVTWSREDDIQHGYYHSVSSQYVKAGLDKDNKVVAWQHRTVFPTIWSTFEPDPQLAHKIELSLGFLELPYNVPNIQLENGKAKAHVRIGWLRSVCNIYHAFAQNTMANMLAETAGRDPLEFLVELIGPDRVLDMSKTDYWNYDQTYEEYPIMTGRLTNVLKLAAEKIGYGKKLPKGEGIGLAVHRSFTTYVATGVHVQVAQDGKITIPHTVVVCDAGRVVNTDRVKSQMEGACIYGMTAGFYSEISAKGGIVQQSNYHDYRMVRMANAPRKIDVHIVENFQYPPGGVGEPGTPPFTPALTNAIFAATGKRITELPISKNGFSV